MPKKTKQSKSRKNRTFRKKRYTLKSRRGGGLGDFFLSKKTSSEPSPETIENSTPKPETFKDLEKLFPNGIPLSVIKVDLDKVDELLKIEQTMFEKFDTLPSREHMDKPEEKAPPVISNVPPQPETEKLF